MESTDTPTFAFDHPYPRYGLAVTLVQAEINPVEETLYEDPAALLAAAREVIAGSLQRFRVHTSDDLESDRVLEFRWLSNDELEESGQKARRWLLHRSAHRDR